MAIRIFVTGGTFDKSYNELTGAMVPYTFVSSDGLFNQGSAIAFVQTLSHGVYIAMNGKCFEADRAQKDKKNRRVH